MIPLFYDGILGRKMGNHQSSISTLHMQVAVRSKGLSLAYSLWCLKYISFIR